MSKILWLCGRQGLFSMRVAQGLEAATARCKLERRNGSEGVVL